MKLVIKKIIQCLSRKNIVWTIDDCEDGRYLTFDDGPTVGVTDKILDLLDALCIKASFFVVGNKINTNYELAQEIHKRGHLLCNHSYSHTKEIYNNYNDLLEEIVNTNSLIESITGDIALYFRPPWGRWYDMNVVKICNKLGMKIVVWSYNTNDLLIDTQKHNSLLRSKNNDIILLHDKYSNTYDMLCNQLPVLADHGIKLKRLQKCTEHQLLTTK